MKGYKICRIRHKISGLHLREDHNPMSSRPSEELTIVGSFFTTEKQVKNKIEWIKNHPGCLKIMLAYIDNDELRKEYICKFYDYLDTYPDMYGRPVQYIKFPDNIDDLEIVYMKDDYSVKATDC